ncbi:hypothetical protein F2P56_033811 [Juglans regia]|uniref:No apical meristem-associated C-terminal domain-containing protein n=1 Tax=Juglans regia TaxID=51240 RepID=A0A833WDC7_JUGRE|nr:hypothetical protein F2P56_033811 [Juglans regia]
MWEIIYEYYHEYKKPNNPERSIASLTNRWQSIQKCTNKFCVAVAQVESLHPSGTTEVDKIEKAKIMYKKIEKANFTMEHCWCLLRQQPKWQQHQSTLSTRRKPHGRRPASASLTPDGDDILDDNVEVILERPPGKKAAKDKERKRKCRDDVDDEFTHAIARMTAERNTFRIERREFNSKQERDRNEHLALEKKKFEAEIMKLDLDGMKPKQQLYF